MKEPPSIRRKPGRIWSNSNHPWIIFIHCSNFDANNTHAILSETVKQIQSNARICLKCLFGYSYHVVTALPNKYQVSNWNLKYGNFGLLHATTKYIKYKLIQIQTQIKTPGAKQRIIKWGIKDFGWIQTLSHINCQPLFDPSSSNCNPEISHVAPWHSI